jgi:hypothetical protein
MPMTAEDRQFITQKIALVGLGVFVLISTLAGAFLLGGSLNAIRTLFIRVPAAAGDTPLVLVGASLKFVAKDASYPWIQDSATTYHMSPNYAVKTIVIKSKSTSDEGDTTTDQLRADVSNAASWEVDEFITQPNGDLQVASITSLGYQINLTATGNLCPGGNTISYGQSPGCVDPIKFSKVTLKVTSQNGATATWGTINCVDSDNSAGTCKIAFRGH